MGEVSSESKQQVVAALSDKTKEELLQWESVQFESLSSSDEYDFGIAGNRGAFHFFLPISNLNYNSRMSTGDVLLSSPLYVITVPLDILIWIPRIIRFGMEV